MCGLLAAADQSGVDGGSWVLGCLGRTRLDAVSNIIVSGKGKDGKGKKAKKGETDQAPTEADTN